MIDKEHIFKVTPTEYCTSNRKELSDYLLVPVSYETDELAGHGMATAYQLGYNAVLASFQKKVPNGAEAVVGYSYNRVGHESAYASGTALIPKK